MPLVDVIVPGPWWNALTYETDESLPPGVRVLVPVGRSTRVGFVLGPARSDSPSGGSNFRVRRIVDILDETCPLNAGLWELALWMGHTFLCGVGLALKALCPAQLLRGDPAPAPEKDISAPPIFREAQCFNPWDGERREFYLRRLEDGKKTLILFSEAGAARVFFASLPAGLRSEAMLWPSTGGKKLWNAWRAARTGEARIVVAPPGGVFAPLKPDLVIVEDEASPAYVFQRSPRVPSRSLAGKRASLLGAELVLGGRLPSSKTFLRTKPACSVLPDPKNLVFADVRRSLMGEERGVEGTLPLTVSLLDRTRETLAGGRHVLWILDRRGEAAEVFCVECGHPVRCPRCGGTMRSEVARKQAHPAQLTTPRHPCPPEAGRSLRCVRCGMREALPSRCPDCQGELWVGRRPGLEALMSIAGRLIHGFPVLLHEGKPLRPESPSLILGTRGALALCDTLDVGLAAWLDLDSELRKAEYSARFQAFSMVWESFWRGRKVGDERTVLVQSRHRGLEWRELLMKGWGRFWKKELPLRAELDFPPFGLMAQIDLPSSEDREALTRLLENEGLFVMDPGESGAPLWVNAHSAGDVARALSPRFNISRSQDGFPSITLWTE